MSKYFVLITTNNATSASGEATTPEEAFAFVKEKAKLGDFVVIYAPDGSPYRTGYCRR